MAFSAKFLTFQTPQGTLRVESTSLHYLITKETANCTLPVFQFKLDRPTRTLMQAIVDRTPVGINIIDSDGTTLVATGYIVEYHHDPLDAESIVVNGTYSLAQFVTSQRDAIWSGASNDVIAALPSVQTLKVIDETLGTTDTQAWVQGGRSDRNLALDVLLHSKLTRADAAMLLGINWHGELRLCETPAATAQAKWVFTTVGTPKSSTAQAINVRNTGRRFTAVSSTLGTSSTASGFDPTTGKFASVASQVTNTMTRGTLDTSAAATGFQFAVDLDNHHPDYFAAYYANIQKLLSLQRYSIELSSTESVGDVRLLDFGAYFDKQNDPAANPNIGHYVVTEIRKVYTASQTERFFVVSRENPAYGAD